MPEAETEVIIIGGGPVGLGLAIDLALRGKRTLVLERTTDLHRIPKGQNLTQRTGEHLRRWGISDAVRAASPIPPEFGNAGIILYRQLLGEYSYDWFQRAAVRPYYFADNERLPQYELERVMRERVAAMPEITFVTRAKVTEVAQDEDGVDVTYIREAADRPETASARYAVGCDGARSTVRQRAGIEQDVDHKGPRMALLVFRSMELDRLLQRYPGKSIFNVMNPALDGYWQFLGRVDLEGGWFYHAPVPDDATVENFDFRKHLHEFAGREFDLEFEHIGFWDLRISLAKTYRAGRVFIAGDAAHSHPPYGGYGVNTGLEDAANLSWKLAAALDGWAGAGLLDSYGDERHAVFKSVSQDFIGRMIEDFRTFSARYSPERDKAAFDAAWNERANADDVDVTEFQPHYAGSPIVCGEPGAQSGARGKHKIAAEAGYHLAPQPLPDGGDLWDLLGAGFVLLDFAGDRQVADAFERAAKERGVPLDVVFAESHALREAYAARSVLVRPDLFVCWAGTPGGEDAAAILDRATGRIRR